MNTLFALIVSMLLTPAGFSPGEAPSLTQSAPQDTADTDTLTTIADLQRGAFVTVQGTVTRLLDEDEFRVEDASGSVRVYTGWQNRVAVTPGERVTVQGVVDDDLIGIFRPEIYARTLVREDGTVINLRRDTQ